MHRLGVLILTLFTSRNGDWLAGLRVGSLVCWSGWLNDCHCLSLSQIYTPPLHIAIYLLIRTPCATLFLFLMPQTVGLLPTHCIAAMDSAAIQAAYVQSAFGYIEVHCCLHTWPLACLSVRWFAVGCFIKVGVVRHGLTGRRCVDQFRSACCVASMLREAPLRPI